MDPVNKKELKGTHAQRKDKDINNDGKVDSTDKYLHKRRKAISKTKGETATMNPKLDSSKGKSSEMEQKESTIRDKLMAVLEKRDVHYKGAAEAEPMDNNLKGAGAKKMKADIQGNAADPDLEKKSHDDAAKAGRAGPSRKMRPNDNPKGDSKAINQPADTTKNSQTPAVRPVGESYELDEMRQSYAVVDTADGNKVVGTASDEKGAKSIISTSQLPPMKIKDKKTLKIVKVKKKQMIGYPIKEEKEEPNKVESYDNMSGLKAAYASMYEVKDEAEKAAE